MEEALRLEERAENLTLCVLPVPDGWPARSG